MGTHATHQPELSSRQLLALARDVQRTERTTDFADLAEAIKVRLARGGWRAPRPEQITDALEWVLPRQAPAPPAAPLPIRQAPPPLSRDEARAALTHLVQRFGSPPPMKPMPSARVLTVRQAERCRAWQIVAQAIVEQVTRCEAAEEAPHVFDFEDGDDTPGGPRR
jgi:hypothetical protein